MIPQEIALDLTVAWAAVMAFGVAMYVILDGFDLGVGILSAIVPDRSLRGRMMASIAPFWDGNETWLILGGGALFGAFPLAYAILLPALYIPLILFLFALIFRGVAFEFRAKAAGSRFLWDISFAGGSLLAAFSQGVVLGAFVQGFTVENNAYAGGPFDWFSPFSLFTGFSLVAGYALLGATWLIIKSEGHLQDWCYAAARKLVWAVLAAMALVSLATPLLDPHIADRWFSWPNVAWLAPVPIVTGAVALALLRSLKKRAEKAPFRLTIALFLLGFVGLAISLWPYLVPRAVTLHQAAASAKSQGFLLVGVLVLLPIILGYTAYAYHVFRGKVDHEHY